MVHSSSGGFWEKDKNKGSPRRRVLLSPPHVVLSVFSTCNHLSRPTKAALDREYSLGPLVQPGSREGTPEKDERSYLFYSFFFFFSF